MHKFPKDVSCHYYYQHVSINLTDFDNINVRASSCLVINIVLHEESLVPKLQ